MVKYSRQPAEPAKCTSNSRTTHHLWIYRFNFVCVCSDSGEGKNLRSESSLQELLRSGASCEGHATEEGDHVFGARSRAQVDHSFQTLPGRRRPPRPGQAVQAHARSLAREGNEVRPRTPHQPEGQRRDCQAQRRRLRHQPRLGPKSRVWTSPNLPCSRSHQPLPVEQLPHRVPLRAEVKGSQESRRPRPPSHQEAGCLQAPRHWQVSTLSFLKGGRRLIGQGSRACQRKPCPVRKDALLLLRRENEDLDRR